jgi:hypothetical protein
LRHELESGCKLRDLIKVVNRTEEREIPSASPPVEPRQPVKIKSGPVVKPDDSATVSPKKVPARQPQKIKSESAPAEPNDKESGDSEKPAGVEKQQGSLF